VDPRHGADHHGLAVVAAQGVPGAAQVATALIDEILVAAPGFHYRMPELHAGEPARSGGIPTPYPASYHLQAWAAASSFTLLTTLFGITPDLPGGRAEGVPLAQETMSWSNEMADTSCETDRPRSASAWSAPIRHSVIDTNALRPGTTHLAEILDPENRVVASYGDCRDLVLLAAYGPDSAEVSFAHAAVDWLESGSVVRIWPSMPLGELVKLTDTNARPEGTPVTREAVPESSGPIRAGSRRGGQNSFPTAVTTTNAR
jgi:hypothetical protein